jgi:hypothetical protein
MLQNILHTPWYLMRWVRLLVGLFAAFSFFSKLIEGNSLLPIDYLLLVAGIYFLYKALFNTGCEVVNTIEDQQQDRNTPIDYEEIK